MAAECLPESHGMQAASPETSEYLPATQSVHVASGGMFDVWPVVPLFPATHTIPTQVLAGDVSSREYMPEMHAVHDAAPRVSANLPAIQLAQVAAALVVWPCGPAVPLAQGDPKQTDCPSASVYVPDKHGEHVSEDEAPSAFEKVPTSQRMHSEVPTVSE